MKQTSPLDLIQIASPCHVSWDEMTGDERTRFCRHCKLHVYNISEMDRAEAEGFIASREGRACVRLFQRADGTVLTRDCPVGVRYLRQRFARAVAAVAGVCVALLSGTLFGGALSRLAQGAIKAPADAFASWIDPQPMQFQMVMGEICLSNPPPSAPPGSVQDTAETPLPQPTPEQLQAIQQRLEQ
ncbi:MAG TPA: hypothetical protein VFB80_01565 [Pirellulaceae bacterium]|nr:hypothetical protein [Pirellulaceae bacterium]